MVWQRLFSTLNRSILNIDLPRSICYNTPMTTSTWTVTVEQDPDTGDLILPLPADLLAMQGWKEGDTLDWVDNGNGTWTLKKL